MIAPRMLARYRQFEFAAQPPQWRYSRHADARVLCAKRFISPRRRHTPPESDTAECAAAEAICGKQIARDVRQLRNCYAVQLLRGIRCRAISRRC